MPIAPQTAAPQIIDTGHGHMVGIVNGGFYTVMTCSGPVDPTGPVAPGDTLELAFNQDTDDYVSRVARMAGNYWRVTVVRVNRKTITIRSDATGELHKLPFTY